MGIYRLVVAALWVVVRRVCAAGGRAGVLTPIAAGAAGVAAPVLRGAPREVSGVCEGIAPGDAAAGPPAVWAVAAPQTPSKAADTNISLRMAGPFKVRIVRHGRPPSPISGA
jgi:hypothetical protein